MKGNLAKIGMADMIKALSLIGKSGRLKASSEGDAGEVYLKKGTVIYAETHDKRGEDALYDMALWSTGEFNYEPANTLVDRNIHIGSDSLFISLSSRVDRYHYLMTRCPPIDARLSVGSSPANRARFTADEQKLLTLIGKRGSMGDVLKRSPYDDRLKSLEVISRLYANKAFSVAGKSSPVPKDEKAAEENGASLESNLKVVSIGEVVQILVLIHRNGRLTAMWDDREGDVFIQQGNITYAAVEQLEGLGAVYRLLTWRDGYCKFFADVVPEKKNIEKNIESIFVEGIDILAEFSKFMDEFPSLNAYVDVISVTGQETIGPKEAKILNLINKYETLNDVIKHSPYTDIETLKIAAKLYSQRMIGLSKGVKGQKEVDYEREAEDLLKDLL